jgi:predicted deacylase
MTPNAGLNDRCRDPGGSHSLRTVAEEVAATPEPRILVGFRIVTPDRSGLLADDLALGWEVTVGDRLGLVIDAFEEVIEKIAAPVAGVLLTIPVNPAIGTGTWAHEIG